jgi:nucleotide-binding universal stress UspA family protein
MRGRTSERCHDRDPAHLCPIDYSETSHTALEHALAIARWYESEITVLHVIHAPLLPPPPIVFAGAADPELAPDPADKSRGGTPSVARAASAGREDRRGCRPGPRRGNYRGQRRFCRSPSAKGADLIVIGVRGRNPLDLTVFGSTTNQVVRRGSCPVLTLKE